MSARAVYERERYKRLLLSQEDLRYARRYGELILELGPEVGADSTTKYICRGLTTAMVVSYARPFTSNKGGRVNQLPEKLYWGHLTDAEKKLHQRILDRRDSVHAHSDSNVIALKVSVDAIGGVPVAMGHGWNPYVTLDSGEIEKLLEIISKIDEQIVAEKFRLECNFNIGDEF